MQEAEKQLRRSFASPAEGQPAQSTDLKRRLSAARRFVPWGSSKGFTLPSMKPLGVVSSSEESAEEIKPDPKPEVSLAAGIEPLTVWAPGAGRVVVLGVRAAGSEHSCCCAPAPTLPRAVLDCLRSTWRPQAGLRVVTCVRACSREGVHAGPGEAGEPVQVDAMLVKWLRQHQREGVQFMFDCVTGQKQSGGHGWCGPGIGRKGSREELWVGRS